MRHYSQRPQKGFVSPYDSRMDHPLKAEKGNEGRERERNGEITAIGTVAESDCSGREEVERG